MNAASRLVSALVCALLLLPAAIATAADPPDLPIPHVPVAVTHHSAHIGGRMIRYTATAGTIVLTNDKDEPAASVFYVAYTADGAGTRTRPLTFSYNGGPGSASALVHIGAFGPRMVVTTNAATTPPPPNDMVDNENSLLASSDLVFVDAVGTGYSRIVGKGKPADFYGVDQDGRAFAQFIRRYITQNDRWNSPKYLLGESYGTTRSAVVAKMLQDDGIALSGVTLMSSVLDFATLIGGPGDDLMYWLYLPTESAVAAYHHELPQQPADVPAFLQTVRLFARDTYATALAKGANLPAAERDAVAQQLHAYTGLPVAYIERSNLRIPPERFEKQLLADSEETVGRYDGRFAAADIDPIGDSAETDPSSDAVTPAFTATFNRYVHDDLHYRTDAEYVFLSYDVNRQWNWKRGNGGGWPSVNVASDLRDAMVANPYLSVFSANGIYDLATPFYATEYTLGHLGLAPALQSHVRFGYYPSGHMVYLNPVAHAELARDLDSFYRTASQR